MIKKDFKHGDVYVITSLRKPLANGIASKMGYSVYNRDVSYEEAVELHFRYMKRMFPSVDISLETVEKALSEHKKTGFFINVDGEVQTYDNHEKADLIDLMYLKNEKPLSELVKMKDDIIEKNNVELDKDLNRRIWEL